MKGLKVTHSDLSHCKAKYRNSIRMLLLFKVQPTTCKPTYIKVLRVTEYECSRGPNLENSSYSHTGLTDIICNFNLKKGKNELGHRFQ